MRLLRCGCVRAKGNAKGMNDRSPAVARRSCWCSSMEPTAVAALAMVLNHEFAPTLHSLVHQIEQLTRETQHLAQQALQYRRDLLSMRAVLAAALQTGDLDVERMLQNCE